MVAEWRSPGSVVIDKGLADMCKHNHSEFLVRPNAVTRYNASGDTLSFVVRPVTDAATLKLTAGAANAALSGNAAMRLNSTTAGLIMRYIIIYIDDATRTVRARLLPRYSSAPEFYSKTPCHYK